MSDYIIPSELFVLLSDEEQQFICGGQDIVLGTGPLPIGGGTLQGTEDLGKATNMQGTTSSGLGGSIGDNVGQRKGNKTGANTSVITPPALLSLGAI